MISLSKYLLKSSKCINSVVWILKMLFIYRERKRLNFYSTNFSNNRVCVLIIIGAWDSKNVLIALKKKNLIMNVIGNVGNTYHRIVKCVRHVENAISIRFIEHISSWIEFSTSKLSISLTFPFVILKLIRNLNHRCKRVTFHVHHLLMWNFFVLKKQHFHSFTMFIDAKHVWFHTSYHFGFHLIMNRICSFKKKKESTKWTAMCKSTFEEC